MVMGVERTKALLGTDKEIAVMIMYVVSDEKIATWCNAAFSALVK